MHSINHGQHFDDDFLEGTEFLIPFISMSIACRKSYVMTSKFRDVAQVNKASMSNISIESRSDAIGSTLKSTAADVMSLLSRYSTALLHPLYGTTIQQTLSESTNKTLLISEVSIEENEASNTTAEIVEMVVVEDYNAWGDFVPVPVV